MPEPTLVVVFLRGGADGLNIISPTGDADYAAARPERLRVLRHGDEPGLEMPGAAADVDFRFHPQAAGFSELYNAGELAVVHAAGLTDGTRSHFDAEDRMERASKNTGTGGWLGRCLKALQPEGILPVLSVGGSAPESVRGSKDVAVASELEQLIIAGGGDLAPLLNKKLREGFGTHPLLAAPVDRLITLSEVLSKRLTNSETGEFEVYSPSVEYPESYLSGEFRTVAQAIKLDLGMRIATVDFGGWDTHEDQPAEFSTNLNTLSNSLLAFWRDLGDARDRVTVVVMSEFGRRLRANKTGGTDHGFGNAMMVLGGEVKGGQMFGEWPGLSNDALDDGADLAITTDYRHVLAEVLSHRMPGFDPAIAFPDFVPEGRGIFG
ncbi:MAG: DUF1501 domain-containing protein [Paracoccaceae bacterium]